MGLFGKSSRTENVSDPVKLLVIDHEKVERIFDDIKASESVAERQALRAQLALEVERHTAIEERVVYPFIRDHVADGASMVEEAVTEHEEAKAILDRFARADAAKDDFFDALKELEKAIKHHVKEEEGDVFKKLDRDVPTPQLGMLRGQLEAAKAEEGPHPDLPADTPTRTRSTSTKRTTTRSTGPKSRKRESVWVQPHQGDGRWQVRRDNATRASRVFDTQADAVSFGRNVAKREHVEFILAGRDGTIREKSSYGSDPRSTPG